MTDFDPNFRSLCWELLAAFEIQLEEMSIDNRLCKRARAVLAIPQPEPTTSQITFNASPTEEVIRLDKEGFHYKGQFIADAGEAHRYMLVFLKQQAKVEQDPPTDDERLADFAQWLAREMPRNTIIGDPLWWAPRIARAVLERWGK